LSTHSPEDTFQKGCACQFLITAYSIHCFLPLLLPQVLAASFADTDCAIDCRPYAFTHGDASPEFVGFHKIEGLLYRDNDTAGAAPFADRLLQDCISLETALTVPSSFTAELTWGGMIGLAQEIVAKKLSGEEETYSGLSLLILHENWLGISSLYAPFHDLVVERSPEAAAEVNLALDSAVMAAGAYRSGGSTWASFAVLDNYELLAITEASQRVVDALRTAAALVLPPAAEEQETQAPTASPTAAPVPRAAGTPSDMAVFSDLADTMAAEVDALGTAIRGGDLALARQAYEGARPSYEQIEVLALCFPDIDAVSSCIL
jgi:iron uptake system EfeUOB component EfeO/EfeM